MTSYLFAFFDSKKQLKFLIDIGKLEDGYKLVIKTRSGFHTKNIKVTTNLNEFIKDIAKLSEIHHYMTYANIFNDNYIARMIMMKVVNFEFEPFSSLIKSRESDISFKEIESKLIENEINLVNDKGFICITGTKYPNTVVFGCAMMHLDILDTKVTPTCIGYCFAFQNNQITTVEVYTYSGKKSKWNFRVDIRTALLEFKYMLCKFGCTHVIPGNYYYISNNVPYKKPVPLIISMKSYLKDSDYIPYLISNVEAEMMSNLDTRITQYTKIIVGLYMAIIPADLTLVLKINEINMVVKSEDTKNWFNITTTEKDNKKVLFSCLENSEIRTYGKIGELKFEDRTAVPEVNNNEITLALLDVYNNEEAKKCECELNNIVGCAVINLNGLNVNEARAFFKSNIYFLKWNDTFKKPFTCESKIDMSYRDVCKSFDSCKKMIISRFPHIFNETGHPKLDCYLPGMKSGYKRIFDKKMIYSKELTVRYSDAGILATNMFLLCISTETKEAINIDMKHDLLMKNAFPVFVGNSLIPSGSICHEVRERDTFMLLDDMQDIWKILYSTFFNKFIFIAHAWLCANITLDRKSEKFNEFIADYELYIELIRKLIAYYIKVYPNE